MSNMINEKAYETIGENSTQRHLFKEYGIDD